LLPTNLPRQDLVPNTYDYESYPLIKSTGFREYDARWIFEKEINLYGIQSLGLGLGTLLQQRGKKPEIVVAHDFRSYSAAIKQALIVGLMDAGCHVHDIGLAITPMAYFAQFALDIPAVAMVTASHNENGWTGIKMGMDRPLTFGPDEMLALKSLVLEGRGQSRTGGKVTRVHGLFEKYKADLLKGGAIKRKLKVAVVTGNGTAGAFAPTVMRGLGCEVVEIDCKLDHSFPNYNPNPEDLKMLHVMSDAVKAHKCDVALGFDGDGDRLGVVDNEGQEIFADKLGVMIARDMAAQIPNAKFVVDVKSTGLFKSDPVLKSLGAKTDYWKTGHSYIKARTKELNATSGFEKSGHFFLCPPFGHGYDDGLASAIVICRMLDRANPKSMAELYRKLPKTFCTPTMSPHCGDTEKYSVIDSIIEIVSAEQESGALIAGQAISTINTVNGIRFEFADGSFGLIRASSNKPELVVVCESVVSKEHMSAIFAYIEGQLAKFSAVGKFNQKIE
jgi:phosphomannomutase / phosphoglucomutase